MKYILTILLLCTTLASAQTPRKVVYGWVTFSDTKWPTPYTSGNIPADSLPWEVLTHVGLFAPNGAQPPQSYYLQQFGAFTAFAHKKGVYAGITVGGSGDAALVTMVAGGPATWRPWIKTYLGYVDQHKMDFIDFDFEGSYTPSMIAGFFGELYDSMQTRWSGLNSSKHPFIVLTASVPHAISWVSTQSRVEMVNAMTYDYNNDAWGRVTFDNSVKSYKNDDGSGGATDSVGTGTNAIAPSMQRMAKRIAGAGWPMAKINVGLDFNGGGWRGAAAPRVSLTGAAGKGSNDTFAKLWPRIKNITPTFDDIAQTYWLREADTLWTFVALPGYEGGMAATRRVMDAMGVGLCLWNLGNEVWNVPSTSIPPGGRGWHYSQLRKYMDYGVATPPPPPPPPPPVTTCDTAATRADGYNQGYVAGYNSGWAVGKASVNIDSIATANQNKGFNAALQAVPNSVAVPKPAPKP